MFWQRSRSSCRAFKERVQREQAVCVVSVLPKERHNKPLHVGPTPSLAIMRIIQCITPLPIQMTLQESQQKEQSAHTRNPIPIASQSRNLELLVLEEKAEALRTDLLLRLEGKHKAFFFSCRELLKMA